MTPFRFLILFGLGVWAMMALGAILATVFWAWMLVDVIRSKNPDKTLWFFFILFTHLLGAACYYFLGRRKRT